MTRVTVVGGGVVGLTSALELARAGHDVLCVRDRPLMETVSAVAGGLWFPYHVNPPERVVTWGLTSLRRFEALAERGGMGVRVVEGLLVERGEPDRWWTEGLRSRWREAAPAELPAGARSGAVARLPMVDGRAFLPWLERQCLYSGVEFAMSRLESLDEFDDGVIVVAAGLSSPRLLGDADLNPSLGQVVHLRDPGLTRWLVDDELPEGMVYVLPHGDRVICGGTDVPWGSADEPKPDPDPQIEAAILDRCRAAVPELADAPVVGRATGLRPVSNAVRLEARHDRGRTVISNYGHGGAGITLSWGCAEEVARMVGPA